jgi:virginiamycin B lyase
VKRFFLAGVIASGCLLPRLEVDPSLLGSGAGQGGAAQGQAGTHNGERGGSSGTAGSGAHGPAGGSPDQATGGAEAGAPDEATAGTTLGGSNVGGGNVGGGSVGGGTPGGGTAGSGTAGTGGMLGDQVGAFTLFISFGISPTHIALGSDNNLWITDASGNISRVTQAGEIKTFTLPAANLARQLQAIVAGPDGALWFTDFRNKVVGRISLAGEVTFFTPSMTLQSSVSALVTGPDGYLWGSVGYDDVIFRLSTAGVFKFFAPTAAQGEIQAGKMASNQFLIYAATGRPGITAISNAGVYTPLDFPPGHAIAAGLAIGSDGQVWFSTNSNAIGKTSPAGVTVDYPVTGSTDVFSPVAGPDNHMWFVAAGATRGAGQLLRVSYDGKIDYVPYPARLDTPSDMIAGGSNDLWITCGTNTANVARLDISKL